jgi:hypothetical protein
VWGGGGGMGGGGGSGAGGGDGDDDLYIIFARNILLHCRFVNGSNMLVKVREVFFTS